MKDDQLLSNIDFSLETLQRDIDKVNPNSEKKPVIGISANHNHVDENRLTHTYSDCIRHAGGIPLIIPQTTDLELLLATISRCDGLILSGGCDIHSLWWSEDPDPGVNTIDHLKDYYDLALVKCAIKWNIPILGICRGLQILNVALGGTLIQDLASKDNLINHNQTASRYEVWHKVHISPNSRLKRILREEELLVNSFHHQAVGVVAPSGSVCATSSDGVIEAVDYFPEYNALGVQWHPEALAWEGKTAHHHLFTHIVDEAKLYHHARSFHKHHLTLDSHVDTPSILVGNPCAENLQPKVDCNGMITGGLDLVFMAAYVAQGSEKPFEQVLKMLEATDAYVAAHREDMKLIGDTATVLETKRLGQKMVCRAVENGYAIGGDLHKLEELANRGVKYMTLCHNGDNLICDSALKSSQTHGGLSDFGVEVVREMNRLGIAVDVSHASDSTVAQVLEISEQPIIASHSSCRAIYNHPRNLPDELLRAIAEKGGVVQICMYHGFLREQGATLADFVNHIEHAIDIMGADRVGIGTDFDGGGEVIGCRSTSQLLRITMEMMARGLAIKQLEGIWGKNLLKVIL